MVLNAKFVLMFKVIFKISLVLSLVFFSCNSDKKETLETPNYVLNEDIMAIILTDAYLAEGASGINVKGANGMQFDSVYLFNPFKDHNVTRSKFDSSLTYYSQNPKKLKAIYDQVLQKLSEYQSRIQAEKAMQQMK